jgi:hypothetical protein
VVFAVTVLDPSANLHGVPSLSTNPAIPGYFELPIASVPLIGSFTVNVLPFP